MGQKKQIRRAMKGLVQDSLNGLAAPQVAGAFPFTGQQGISPATLGLRPVGSLGPVNSLPGVSATLQGGESPLIIDAESRIDNTEDKRMQKKVRKAAKRAAKKSLLAKAQRDPIEMLSRLELLAGRLRPNDPRRLRAASVVLKAKLRANDAAASGGSVAKGVMELGSIDSAAEIANAMQDVEAALGLSSGSTAPFDPARLDARQQLQNIMNGGQSESSRGTQNSGALEAYTSPASALGAVLKQTGLGDELVAAEALVKEAERSGDSGRLSAAHERLTLAKLKAAHRLTEPN